MIEWIQNNEVLFWWLFAASIVTFVGSLIVVPMLLVRIPRDYFAHQRRHKTPWDHQHWVIQWIMITAKNAAGAVLLVVGLLMVFTPGQGIITMVVGLILLDYPGKYRLERWIISRPAVFRSINWFRRRAGRAPLVL